LKKYQKQGVKCFWGDILKNGFITHTNAPQAIRVKKGLLRTLGAAGNNKPGAAGN